MNDRFLIHDEAAEENKMDEPANEASAQEADSFNYQALQSPPQPKINEEREMPAAQLHTPTLIEAQPAPQQANGDGQQPWFSQDEAASFHSRWMDIQTRFVDTPEQAVSQGDELVSETIERMKDMISSQYASLCDKWSNHNDLSTEDMRIVMQDYRFLLDRLLDL